MKTITWCHSGNSRMGNIKQKDEMELIYMLIDLTGIRNIREQDEPDIGILQTVVVQTHIDDGIKSLEQITEAIDSSTENIKEQYMNNSEQQGQREHRWQY